MLEIISAFVVMCLLVISLSSLGFLITSLLVKIVVN